MPKIQQRFNQKTVEDLRGLLERPPAPPTRSLTRDDVLDAVRDQIIALAAAGYSPDEVFAFIASKIGTLTAKEKARVRGVMLGRVARKKRKAQATEQAACGPQSPGADSPGAEPDTAAQTGAA